MPGCADRSEPVLSVSFTNGPYQLLPFDSPLVHESIVPVVGWNGQHLECLGTAFAIAASGVFVTARHVIDTWVDEFGDRTHTGTAGLYVLYESDRVVAHPNGEDASLGGPLAVGSISCHPTSDLAVLHAQTPYVEGQPVTFPILELTVALPRIADHCVAVGYARMHLDGAVHPRIGENRDLISVDYDRQLAATRGVVENVHPVQRDTFRLTWPCFLIDARYDKGMSGSPVLNAEGRVVGVVCSSTPPVFDQPFTSYATLTADLLPLHLQVAGTADSVLIADLLGGEIDGFGDIDVIDDTGVHRLVYTDEAVVRALNGRTPPTAESV